MAYNYSYQKFDKETMARSCGSNLKISMKKSVETLRSIRGKKVSVAIRYMEEVANQKAVVPYFRYTSEMPHQKGKGISSGGFPVSIATEVITLLKNAQKNAAEQEISGELYVLSASARQGTRRYHMGRYSGRQMKSTNVEIVVGLRGKKK